MNNITFNLHGGAPPLQWSTIFFFVRYITVTLTPVYHIIYFMTTVYEVKMRNIHIGRIGFFFFHVQILISECYKSDMTLIREC